MSDKNLDHRTKRTGLTPKIQVRPYASGSRWKWKQDIRKVEYYDHTMAIVSLAFQNSQLTTENRQVTNGRREMRDKK